mgnify:CR=1 FL=1
MSTINRDPREVIREIELADRLHARDRGSDEDGAGQHRAGVVRRARKQH